MVNFPFWIAFFIGLNVQPRIQILNEVQYVKAAKTNERRDDLKCHQNTLTSKNYKSLNALVKASFGSKPFNQFIHPTMKVNSFIVIKPYYLPINRLYQISLHHKYKNSRVNRLFLGNSIASPKLRTFKTFKKKLNTRCFGGINNAKKQ